ncbi:MAG: squalene synthase HpnC [Planctomycetota bacterium]|jgi:squalene synthase HpnC
MTISPVQQLDIYGPERCETLSVEQARQWCRRLARSRYENFTVLSRLMPRRLRDDYAALYAFCRWADDLGDEVGDRDRSLELLAWWRRELQQCIAGEPRHPVFIALAPTIQRHELPVEPFDDLIKAFEQDQTVTRYDTWEQVLGYCRLSADPVGRLVLMIGGEPRRDDLYELSDAVCTALQLTNHWQDVRRDVLERDRIYIPSELIEIDRFEQRLVTTARQGFAPDREFFGESRLLVRACVERTWPLFEKGEGLLAKLGPQTRPFVRLFLAGGMRVLRAIEAWNCETVLYRPRLSKAAKLALVARAWFASRLGRRAST